MEAQRTFQIFYTLDGGVVHPPPCGGVVQSRGGRDCDLLDRHGRSFRPVRPVRVEGEAPGTNASFCLFLIDLMLLPTVVEIANHRT